MTIFISEDQDKMLHTLPRARKTFSPLIWLNFAILLTWPNLSAGVTAQTSLRFLFISGVLGLQIRRGQIRWKANTPGYNFYERTLPGFYLLHVRIPSRIRVTDLLCFVNGQSISNFIFNPIFLLRYSHAFTIYMATRLIMISQGYLH